MNWNWGFRAITFLCSGTSKDAQRKNSVRKAAVDALAEAKSERVT